MLSRIAAVVAAVVLIAAAFAYRDRNDNVEAGGGTGGRVRLYCATEVTDVCESAVAGKNVELHVEPAGLTFDRIVNAATSAAAGVDVWVAPAPYPTMAAEARQRKAATDITGTPRKIGGARLALVVWKDRQAVMAKACSGTITWKCIGEIAGKGAWTASGGRAEWGLVKAGIPDPAFEAAGILALGTATVGYFDRADLSSVDLAENDGFRAWLAGLAGAVPAATPDLARMLSTGPAVLDFLAAFEPTAAPAVRAAVRGSTLSVIYPAPVVTTDIQLVAVGRANVPDDLRDRLTRQLRDGRWSGNARGVPAPGLLDALRSTWKETRR